MKHLRAIPRNGPFLETLPSGCKFRTAASCRRPLRRRGTSPARGRTRTLVRAGAGMNFGPRWKEGERNDGPPLTQKPEKHFPCGRGFCSAFTAHVKAVDGVSFHLDKGRPWASWASRAAASPPPDGGAAAPAVTSGGAVPEKNMLALGGESFAGRERNFPDGVPGPLRVPRPPDDRLRHRGEPLAAHGLASSRAERDDRVVQILEEVGLDSSVLNRYASSSAEASGSASASPEPCSPPSLVVADEPVSAWMSRFRPRSSTSWRTAGKTVPDLPFIAMISAGETHQRQGGRHVLGRIVETARRMFFSLLPLHPYTPGPAFRRACPGPGKKSERSY